MLAARRPSYRSVIARERSDRGNLTVVDRHTARRTVRLLRLRLAMTRRVAFESGILFPVGLNLRVHSLGVDTPRLAASSSYRRTPDQVQGRSRYPEGPTGFPRIQYGAGLSSPCLRAKTYRQTE
jgi:hypothetical protein